MYIPVPIKIESKKFFKNLNDNIIPADASASGKTSAELVKSTPLMQNTTRSPINEYGSFSPK